MERCYAKELFVQVNFNLTLYTRVLWKLKYATALTTRAKCSLTVQADAIFKCDALQQNREEGAQPY